MELIVRLGHFCSEQPLKSSLKADQSMGSIHIDSLLTASMIDTGQVILAIGPLDVEKGKPTGM